MEGLNQPLYKIVNAQLENSADLREGQKRPALEEELLGKSNQNQSDQSVGCCCQWSKWNSLKIG